MTTVCIGKLDLGMIPRIAVPLFDDSPGADAVAVRDLTDLIELRIDCFADRSPEHIVAVVKEIHRATSYSVPVIATVRSADEGGKVAIGDDERTGLYEAILPFVDAVDVELRAKLRDRILDAAHEQGRATIVSYHDFDETPPEDSLHRIVETGRSCGASIVKIATAAQETEDVVRLLEVTLQHRRKNVITIAMGTLGAISRVFFPLAGSCISYAYHRTPTGPGQLSLPELHGELRRYYPAFGRHDRGQGG